MLFNPWIRDGKNADLGSGIRNKHPGSATLIFIFFSETCLCLMTSMDRLKNSTYITYNFNMLYLRHHFLFEVEVKIFRTLYFKLMACNGLKIIVFFSGERGTARR